MPPNIEKIRKLMGEKSEVVVAREAGISRTTLRKILSGQDFQFSSFDKLASALKAKTKDIVL